MSTMIISPQVPYRGAEYSKLTSITWSMGLLHTFNSMRLNDEMCDIKILLSNKTSISAHSCVLAGASPFLKTHLHGVVKPDINMESFPAEIVKEIVEFIYTGTATVRKEDMFVFHSVSAMLNLSTLTEMAVKLMQNNVGPNINKDINNIITQEQADDFSEQNEGSPPTLESTDYLEPQPSISEKVNEIHPMLDKEARVVLKKIDAQDIPKEKSPRKKKPKPVVQETVTPSRKSDRKRKGNAFLEEVFDTSFGKKKNRNNIEPEEVEIKEEIEDEEFERSLSQTGTVVADSIGAMENLQQSPVSQNTGDGTENAREEGEVEGDVSLTNVRECDSLEIREMVNSALAQFDDDACDDDFDDDDGGMDAAYSDNEENVTSGKQSESAEESSKSRLNADVVKENEAEKQLEEVAAEAELHFQAEGPETMKPKPIQVFRRKGDSYMLETVIPQIDEIEPAYNAPVVQTLSDPSLPDLNGKGVYIKPMSSVERRRRTKRNIHGIALVNNMELPHHDGLTFMCEVCKRCFTDQEFFERHRERHYTTVDKDDPVKRFHCPFCPYKSKYKALLVEHQRIHTGEKPFECDKCDRKFIRKKDLKLHLDMHNNVKYTCDVCAKVFNTYPNYRKHHRYMHTAGNLRPHKCPICNATFKIAQSLTRHLYTHSNRRPHVCSHCPKEFFSRNALKKHIDHKHLGTGTVYQCAKCGKEYLTKRSMKKHVCKTLPTMEKRIRPSKHSGDKSKEQLIAEGAVVVLDDELKEFAAEKMDMMNTVSSTPRPSTASKISGKVVTVMTNVSDGETSGESDLEDISEDRTDDQASSSVIQSKDVDDGDTELVLTVSEEIE